MLQNRDHRFAASYPVELPIQYRTEGGNPIAGHGRTVTIGRAMLCFRGDRPLPVNRKLRLAVDWPAALPEDASLTLWVLGTITRCGPGTVEVRVETYEFKARRASRASSSPTRRRPNARAMTSGMS